MSSPCFVVPRSCRFVLPLILAGFGALWTATTAHAQQQERGLLDRINHPDMSLHYDGFSKGFDAKSMAGNRKVSMRSFAFGRSAVLKAGGGTFQTRGFESGRSSFRTSSFSTGTASVAGRSALPQVDRSFATRPVDLPTDRQANKTMDVRQYASWDKPFLVPGKRQDTIDELRRQKNLSINQVREILNKNQ